MSTSKHFDKICVAIVAVMLVITILFMNGQNLGISLASRVMGYEVKLFNTEKVHEVNIVMDDWDNFIENCESEEYYSCAVAIDGESYKNIAIRAKGNTSLSSVKSLNSQRYSFKLEFDHYENGKSYHGLDKLCLNNIIQDNTMMKDYLVYQMMNEFGVESPLCSFVYITVNGKDWGLYLAVEGIEDGFLQRNYGSDEGELYKPDSMSNGGGRGNGKDFNMDSVDLDGANPDTSKETTNDNNIQQSNNSSQNNQNRTPPQISNNNDQQNRTPPQMPNGNFGQNGSENGQTETNNNQNGPAVQQPQGDAQNSSIPTAPDGKGQGGANGGSGRGNGSDDVKLKYIDDDTDSYSNIFDNAKTDVNNSDKKRLIASLKNLSAYTNIEETVNTEEVIRYFVIHNFVCNGDSYTGNMIHNYYLHENDGQLSMIPWDYNLAFGTFQGNEASSTINTSIDSPVSGGNVDDRPMIGWIFSSEEYTNKYHEVFSEFLSEWFENGKLENMISEIAEMIRPYVEKDPTKFCTLNEFDAGVTTITKFVNLRAEAVQKQLNGDTTTVNTDGLTLSDMGTMNNRMGGGKGENQMSVGK